MVVFGIGGLIRFRSSADSSRDTVRLIIVTLAGLIAGLGLLHFAVMITVFTFVLIWLFDTSPPFRIRIEGLAWERCGTCAEAYRDILKAHGCTIIAEHHSLEKERIEFVFRLPRRSTPRPPGRGTAQHRRRPARRSGLGSRLAEPAISVCVLSREDGGDRMMENLSRRDLAALGVGAALCASGAQAQNDKPLLRRPIPHGKGETIPIIGVGTSEVFEVGSSAADRAGPTGVVQALIAGGGSLIDTAPSYGKAEAVVGDILAATGLRAPRLHRHQAGIATGPAGMESEARECLGRLKTAKLDMLQLHNVRDPAQDMAELEASSPGHMPLHRHHHHL